MEYPSFFDLLARTKEMDRAVHDVIEVPPDGYIAYGENDFGIQMSIGFDDSEVEVTFYFRDTGNNDEDGRIIYDVEMVTGNGDWASPRDQLERLACAVDYFETHGFNEAFNDRMYVTVGM